jgi:hypothetical protein
MTTDRGWQDGDIDFSMLEGFMQSLSGQIPNERISQLTRRGGSFAPMMTTPPHLRHSR